MSFEFEDLFPKMFGDRDPKKVLNKVIDHSKVLKFIEKRSIDYIAKDFESQISETREHWEDGEHSYKSTNSPTRVIDGAPHTFTPNVTVSSEDGQIDWPGFLNWAFELGPFKEKYAIFIPFKNGRGTAIRVAFSDFDRFLIFVSHIDYNFKTKKQQEYLKRRFSQAMRTSDVEDKFKIYYAAPVWLSNGYRYDLKMDLLRSLVQTNLVGYKETVVLRLLNSFLGDASFLESEKNLSLKSTRAISNRILYSLIETKVGDKSLFQLLYEKINDVFGEDNFTRFIQVIYRYWILSDYQNPMLEGYRSNDTSSPLILDYTSKKILGFYATSHDFSFSRGILLITQTKITATAHIKSVSVKTETAEVGTLHPFQPIAIKPSGNLKGKMSLPSNTIPAFFLKAFDDKNYWDNFEKGIFLTIDIMTTVFGVGNLLKLRYLLKIGTAFSKIRIAAGFAEVASGGLSALISLHDTCEDENSDLCKKIRYFLIALEVFSFSADGYVELILRNSSKDLLKHLPKDIPDETLQLVKYYSVPTTSKFQTFKTLVIGKKHSFHFNGKKYTIGDPPYVAPQTGKNKKYFRINGTTRHVNYPPGGKKSKIYDSVVKLKDESRIYYRNKIMIIWDQLGFPIFQSRCDVLVPRKLLGVEHHHEHAMYCCSELAKNLKKDKSLAKKMDLNQTQVDVIYKNSKITKPEDYSTIPGLVWHHHQDLGRMQLVNLVEHFWFSAWSHLGGWALWGRKNLWV